MGNKKIVFCIVMFLVIFLFGIIGPDLKNRDKYLEEKPTTTTQNITSVIEKTEVTTEQVAEQTTAKNTEQVVEQTTEQTTAQAVDNVDEKSKFVFTEIIEVGKYLFSDDCNIIYNNNYVLSRDVEREIDEIIASMTIEEKVGQLFFIKNDGRFDGSILSDYPVGGVILFKGDFAGKSEETVKDNIINLQDNSEVPLLIGIDEEGGTVVRLSCYSMLAPYQFKSPRDLYYAGGFTGIKEDAVAKSELLLSYGINVNFAPVCDVPDSNGDFIYTRSFSEDVELTEEYVQLMVETMNECNMGSVLKHFPGYGNNVDTHNSVARDLRPIDEFENVDLKPFQMGIDSGAWCVLINHNIVECMDKDNPASLSPDVHDLLRQDMEFGGVIITDDLMMGGIADLYTKEEAAVQAVLSGNDMILATDYQVQYEAVLNAVKSGRIKEEQVEESIKRILRWKYSLGLLDI